MKQIYAWKAFKTARTYIYSVCGPFTKNLEKIQKFKETGDSQYICQKELRRACFHHDITYGDFKELTWRVNWTAFSKILLDKALKINGNPKYNGYNLE